MVVSFGTAATYLGDTGTYRDLVLSMYQYALLRPTSCWLCISSFSLLLFNNETWGGGICSISISPPGCCCCLSCFCYCCCLERGGLFCWLFFFFFFFISTSVSCFCSCFFLFSRIWLLLSLFFSFLGCRCFLGDGTSCFWGAIPFVFLCPFTFLSPPLRAFSVAATVNTAVSVVVAVEFVVIVTWRGWGWVFLAGNALAISPRLCKPTIWSAALHYQQHRHMNTFSNSSKACWVSVTCNTMSTIAIPDLIILEENSSIDPYFEKKARYDLPIYPGAPRTQ